jgi:hypothetical protein
LTTNKKDTSFLMNTPHQRTCACSGHDAEKLRKLHEDVKLCSQSFALNSTDENTIIYVPVIYHVLYKSSVENIPLSQIQENHKEINRCFQALNQDINKVPSSGDYDFADMIGNPSVAFLPTNENDILDNVPFVTRKQISVDNIDLDKALALQNPFEGYLNIYIADAEFLGQAGIGSNVCIVDFETVGSPESPGISQSYGNGRTLVHEIGHCFSLEHPWVSQCIMTINDLPRTKNPNYNAVLEPVPLGDNHWTDVNAVTVDASCTGAQPPPVGYYELFMTYMEYVRDNSMVMFTKGQAKSMRVWLDTAGREVLDLQEGDAVVVTNPPLGPEDSVSGNKLTSTEIAMIVLGAVLVILIVALIVAQVNENKNN